MSIPSSLPGKVAFSTKISKLNLKFSNQAENTPVVLTSNFKPIKMWVKSVQGFLSYNWTNKKRLLFYNKFFATPNSLSVCFFECQIITRELLNRFSSDLDFGISFNYGNVPILVKKFNENQVSRESCASKLVKYKAKPRTQMMIAIVMLIRSQAPTRSGSE